ncbi:MAG TPA: hypothetical protein VG963_12720, partial [Polyangiaceae bacterium]|nr:hypothetical protein [Polyangiaceae bacterium]
GICVRGTSTCVNGANTACTGAIEAKPRDCTSALDNDCDGIPDNTVDAVCTCAVGTTQACDQHTNSSGDSTDGVGICKAGIQTCVLNTGKPGSAWGACTGAVAQAPRNCSSAADNDCDGVPDNTIDAVCTCAISTSQPCGTHPGLDGHGNCRAGVQLCVGGDTNNSSSAWAACTGSVGPAGADSCTVAGDDSNCDGIPNGGCQCVGSNSANCTDPAASRCSAGQCVPCSSASDCTHIAGMTTCTAGVCQAGGTTTP